MSSVCLAADSAVVGVEAPRVTQPLMEDREVHLRNAGNPLPASLVLP